MTALTPLTEGADTPAVRPLALQTVSCEVVLEVLLLQPGRVSLRVAGEVHQRQPGAGEGRCHLRATPPALCCSLSRSRAPCLSPF